MNALERLDDITVHLNSAIDSIKELPERFEPLGFHVGQGGRDIGEEGHTGTGCILDPCYSNVEKLTRLFGATPVSEEGLDLADSLLGVQMSKGGAA